MTTEADAGSTTTKTNQVVPFRGPTRTLRNLEGYLVVLNEAGRAIADAETLDDVEALEIRLKALRREIRRVVKDQDEQRELMRQHAIVMFDLYRKGGEKLEPFVADGRAISRGNLIQSDPVAQDVDRGGFAKRAGVSTVRGNIMRTIANLPDDIYRDVRDTDWGETKVVGLRTFAARWREIKKQRELGKLSDKQLREAEYEAVIARAEKWAQSGAKILHDVSNLPHGWPGVCAYDRLMDALGDLLEAAERFATNKEPVRGTQE